MVILDGAAGEVFFHHLLLFERSRFGFTIVGHFDDMMVSVLGNACGASGVGKIREE